LARTIFTRGTLGRQLRKANAPTSRTSLCKKPQKMLRRQWSMLRSRLGKTLAVALAVDRICPCFVLYLF
jgi:hypothetical protein